MNLVTDTVSPSPCWSSSDDKSGGHPLPWRSQVRSHYTRTAHSLGDSTDSRVVTRSDSATTGSTESRWYFERRSMVRRETSTEGAVKTPWNIHDGKTRPVEYFFCIRKASRGAGDHLSLRLGRRFIRGGDSSISSRHWSALMIPRCVIDARPRPPHCRVHSFIDEAARGATPQLWATRSWGVGREKQREREREKEEPRPLIRAKKGGTFHQMGSRRNSDRRGSSFVVG